MDYREKLKQSWALRRAHLGRRLAPTASGSGQTPPPAPRLGPSQRLRRQVFEQLLRDLESHGPIEVNDEAASRLRVAESLDEILAAGSTPELSAAERTWVEDRVLAELQGLGPMAPLFDDPTVSDILVNGPHEIWVDRFGKLERTSVRFDDTEHLLRLLERLVSAQGRHLDEASPSVDVRLADGSRLHALLPPLVRQPVVSIRRMRVVPFRLSEIYQCGTLTPEMGELLELVVRSQRNVVISGGASSGKTTLLNVLSGFIPREERVITIEETAELLLDHPHVISLEARLANIEGRGEVGLRDLVKGSLRMRPDRIIVGEVRGPEVFDMLQAMNTGHQGSLTTVHANSPEDALRRLENLVQLGGFDLSSAAIRELLGAAFDIIVHLTRFLDGSRRVTSISEVLFEDGELITREIYRFEVKPGSTAEETSAAHVATGVQPSFLENTSQSM